MSGHSHYATIKRAKESKDAARGKVFSRHAKSIAIAIKEGGSASPEMNSKLRFAIDQAKADNMPKVNIDRILARADEVGNIQEVIYEGYGPEGVAVMIKAATDNKNRTSQEIKNIFDRGGGTLAGPGAVSFNFQLKGLVVVKKTADTDSQVLSLIDLGAEDINTDDDEIEIYVPPAEVNEMKNKIIQAGFEVLSFKLIQKPLNFVVLSAADKAKKAVNLMNNLEDHDDVVDVFSNFDIPADIVKLISD